MVDPRSVVPESIMPGYAFMLDRPLETADIARRLEVNRGVGVPYSDEMIANAAADLAAQADPEADTEDLLARYPKAAVGDFDGNPEVLSEMDAMIAYLQILGRMVDFTDLRPEDLRQ
jgi:cytochrome c oxidase cbb3-type subunit 2